MGFTVIVNVFTMTIVVLIIVYLERLNLHAQLIDVQVAYYNVMYYSTTNMHG